MCKSCSSCIGEEMPTGRNNVDLEESSSAVCRCVDIGVRRTAKLDTAVDSIIQTAHAGWVFIEMLMSYRVIVV